MLQNIVFLIGPSNPTRQAKERFSAQSKGVSLRAIDFDGPAGRRSLYISHYPGLEEPDLVVLTTLGEEGWTDFLAAMRPEFEKELGFKNLPEPNLKSFKQHQGMYRSFKWAMAYLAPSGIDPNSLLNADEVPKSQLDPIRVLSYAKPFKLWRRREGWEGTSVVAGTGITAGVTMPDSSNRILRGSICMTT